MGLPKDTPSSLMPAPGEGRLVALPPGAIDRILYFWVLCAGIPARLRSNHSFANAVDRASRVIAARFVPSLMVCHALDGPLDSLVLPLSPAWRNCCSTCTTAL